MTVAVCILLCLLAACAVRYALRIRRYPLAKGVRVACLPWIPAHALTPALASLANRLLHALPLPKPPEGVCRRTETCAAADGARLTLTLYRPEGEKGPLPGLVYFHGGGFCMAAAGYLHRNVADYARMARCVVVSVDYRTADRHPFPVPFDDCCAALSHVWASAKAWGIDPNRLAVGGDSAGGALAAACAQWARDEAKIPLCFQLLIYPVTDSRMQTETMRNGNATPLWNARFTRRMWSIYLRGAPACAYAAPMLAARFDGLPPAYLETAAFDCLRGEGLAYAEALRAAGVAVQTEEASGTCHGFDVFRRAPVTRKMLRVRAQALAEAFSR